MQTPTRTRQDGEAILQYHSQGSCSGKRYCTSWTVHIRSLYIRILLHRFFSDGESGRLVGSVDGQMNRLTYKAEDPKDVRRR